MNKILTLEYLATEYFEKNSGELITSPDELIHVAMCILDGNKFKVYIKRKTLKHFVERRKEDLIKRHTKDRSLEIILGMLVDLSYAITFNTRVDANPKRENSLLFYKDFDTPFKTPVTVVTEIIKNKNDLLIITYYFTKR